MESVCRKLMSTEKTTTTYSRMVCLFLVSTQWLQLLQRMVSSAQLSSEMLLCRRSGITGVSRGNESLQVSLGHHFAAVSHRALSNGVISCNVNEVVGQVGVHPPARIPLNAKAGVEQVPKYVIGPPVGVQFRELRLDPRHACWHRTLTPHGFKAKARDTNCMQLAVWGNLQLGISLFPLPFSFAGPA